MCVSALTPCCSNVCGGVVASVDSRIALLFGGLRDNGHGSSACWSFDPRTSVCLSEFTPFVLFVALDVLTLFVCLCITSSGCNAWAPLAVEPDVSGTVPAPRWSGSYHSFGSGLAMYGGRTARESMGDLWRLDF